MLKVIEELIEEFGTKNRQRREEMKERHQEAKHLCAAIQKIHQVTPDSKQIEGFADIKDQVDQLMSLKATLLHPPNYNLYHTGELQL